MENFHLKNVDVFLSLFKTKIVDTGKIFIRKVVIMSTHNLSFGAKIRKMHTTV